MILSTAFLDACLRRHDGDSLINFRIIAVYNFLRSRRHSREGGNLIYHLNYSNFVIGINSYSFFDANCKSWIFLNQSTFQLTPNSKLKTQNYSTQCKYIATGINAKSKGTMIENAMPTFFASFKYLLLYNPSERKAL